MVLNGNLMPKELEFCLAKQKISKGELTRDLLASSHFVGRKLAIFVFCTETDFPRFPPTKMWELANNDRAGTAGGQKMGQFYGKSEIIGLIALFIFSASFWSNKIPTSFF